MPQGVAFENIARKGGNAGIILNLLPHSPDF